MRPKHTKPLASKHAGDVNEWPDPLMITRKGKGGSTSSTYERVKDDDGSPVNEVNKQGVLCPKYQCACGGEVLFNANTKPHITRAEHQGFVDAQEMGRTQLRDAMCICFVLSYLTNHSLPYLTCLELDL